VSALIDTASASLLAARHHGDGGAPAGHVTRSPPQQLFAAGAVRSTSPENGVVGNHGVAAWSPFVFVLVAAAGR